MTRRVLPLTVTAFLLLGLVCPAASDGAANSAPTISNVVNQTIAEDGATGALAFTVGDVETAAASL